MKTSDIVIKSFESGYTVDNNGVIRNPSGQILDGYVAANGYRVVSTYGTMYVHKFCAYVWFKRLDGVVRHLDHNKLNNSRSNIAMGTHKDNFEDNPEETRMKFQKIAAENRLGTPTTWNHSLSENEVIEVRTASGTNSEIAKAYGVSTETIRRIRKGLMYRNVGIV